MDISILKTENLTIYCTEKGIDPYGDDDKDGLLNREELYIYKKNGKKYLGYNSHPLLKDTDGDGFFDFDDKDPLKWNITARDMAMFMEITYKDDYFIKQNFFTVKFR